MFVMIDNSMRLWKPQCRRPVLYSNHMCWFQGCMMCMSGCTSRYCLNLFRRCDRMMFAGNSWSSQMDMFFVCRWIQSDSNNSPPKVVASSVQGSGTTLPHVRLVSCSLPATNRRLDSAQSGRIKMQKSGIKFWELMPRTIVPLDSAFIFTLYAMYYTALSPFRQYVF